MRAAPVISECYTTALACGDDEAHALLQLMDVYCLLKLELLFVIEPSGGLLTPDIPVGSLCLCRMGQLQH